MTSPKLGHPPAMLPHAPERAVFFASKEHMRAAAFVRKALGPGRKGGVLLAPAGSGKTAVLETVLNNLRETPAAMVSGPRSTLRDMLEELARVAGVLPSGNGHSMTVLIHALAQCGRPPSLLVDRAETLSEQTLAGLRLFWDSRLGLGGRVKVVLAGRPELKERLTPDMRRALGKAHVLGPMRPRESRAFLRESTAMFGRLLVPFTPQAEKAVAKHSGGRPRLVLALAAKAQGLARQDGLVRVGTGAVSEAAKRLLPRVEQHASSGLLAVFVAVCILIAVFLLAVMYRPQLLELLVRSAIVTHGELAPLPDKKPGWLKGVQAPSWVLPASTEVAVSTAERIVTVRPGDTLARMCRRVYGLAGKKALRAVQNANPELKAAGLQVGQALRFPELAL